MTGKVFKPFADDASVLTIAGLSLENGTQSLVLHGEITIERSSEGMKRVRDLVTVLQSVLEAGEAVPTATGTVEPAAVVDEVANPFA